MKFELGFTEIVLNELSMYLLGYYRRSTKRHAHEADRGDEKSYV